MAHKNKLPKLVELSNIKGDLHTHSSYDIKTSHDTGANSYRELMTKAAALGYKYVGVYRPQPKTVRPYNTRHNQNHERSQTSPRFRGQKSKKVAKFFIRLEVDILPNGNTALPKLALPYEDNTLLFLLVSAFHSSFRMSKVDMTKRVVQALSVPKVKILGHPTGRLINKRPGIDLNWAVIFETVKINNQALEINSWPERLDFPDTLVCDGIRFGVKCIVDTDAHASEQMDNMKYGISVARRGWAEQSDIMNTLPYQEFKNWITK